MLAPFILRRHWAEIFPATPATLLAWHRKLAANKYDRSNRANPASLPGGSRGRRARMAVKLAAAHADTSQAEALGVIHDGADSIVGIAAATASAQAAQ